MHREALLRAAVANNAMWCDAVCRSHDYPGVFSARLWISEHHDLEFYPNVITLRPDVTAPEKMVARDQSGRYAVKDSFARLDLAADGLTMLFEAEWIACPLAPAEPAEPGLSWDTVTDAAELCRWQTAWAQGSSPRRPLFRPELLADPRCAILSCRRDGDLAGGIIAYAAAGVTGISNLFGAGLPAGQLWASALQAVAAFRPDLPIVGYEHGTSLAAARQAGCQPLGRLRVWTRNLLVPVRRTVSAQALVVVWLGSLTPADAGFFIVVFRQDRLVVWVRWHVSIISPPSRQPPTCPRRLRFRLRTPRPLLWSERPIPVASKAGVSCDQCAAVLSALSSTLSDRGGLQPARAVQARHHRAGPDDRDRGYGSPTITDDLMQFDAYTGYGTPPFRVIRYGNVPPFDPSDSDMLDWASETSLDVESAHAGAPLAKIVLVEAAGQDAAELAGAVDFAATHRLGDVISLSWAYSVAVARLHAGAVTSGSGGEIFSTVAPDNSWAFLPESINSAIGLPVLAAICGSGYTVHAGG